MARGRDITDDRAAAFIAACLEPPASAVRVDDPVFLRQVRRDAKDRWHHGMLLVHATHRAREAADYMNEIRWREGREKLDTREQSRAFVAAVHAQMQIPAPGLVALRWKRQHRKIAGGRPEWEDATAADEARLETKEA